MALGNNRDYKTADRRARKALARHKEIMDRLISEGVERIAASAEALRIMEEGKKPKTLKLRSKGFITIKSESDDEEANG